MAGLASILGLLVHCVLPALAAETLRLEVRRDAQGQPRLAWPLLPPAILETRATLASDAPWQGASVPAEVIDGWNLLTPTLDRTQRFYRLRLVPAPSTTRLAERSPAPGESGVSVTRETSVRFTRPVELATPAAASALVATLGDRRLLGRVELAADRLGATLFHLEPLPASARIRIDLDGSAFVDVAGDAVDADADGRPGGRATWEFDTAPIHALPGTSISGRVLASQRLSGTNVPLVGVTITVDGAEETLRAVTAADGTFRLDPCPSGRFFVHVDGRTAVGSRWPNGAYYPYVGKAWEAAPGRTNNLANGDGLIYLPHIAPSALQAVQPGATTVVTPPAEALQDNPALVGVQLAVPPNALFADSGTRGGRVGLAAVAPDRLPEPLPPGLRLPLVITVQTDGAMNFDQPVPVRFPNLPDPATGALLPPGARTAIWSFNHDTGRWEIAAPAVVTADGRFAESLPGTGIRQPGWHGSAPGSQPRGPGDGPRRPDSQDNSEDGDDDEDCDQDGALLDAALGALDCGASLAGISPWTDAISNLGRNLVDYMENVDAMVEATSTPGFSCERAAAGFSMLNVIGRTLVDLGRPVLVTGDPSRFAAAAGECLLNGAQITARLACASRCANGSVDASRCQEMNNLIDAGIGIREIAEADSAIDAGIAAAELAADQLTSAYSAHCRERGGGALQRFLPAGTDTEGELRRAALTLRSRIAALQTAIGNATSVASAFADAYRNLESGLLEPASRWMIEDRGWSGAYYRLSTPDSVFRQQVGPTGDFRLPILAPNRAHTLEVYLPSRALYAVTTFRSADSGNLTDVPAPRLTSIANRILFPDRDADGLPDVVEEVLGSLPDDPDTDRDGTPDGVEAARGGHPAGAGIVLDGVIANVPAGGDAVDLVEVGPRTVGVVLESGTVQLFDTSNPEAPVRGGSFRVGTSRPRVAASAPWLLVADAASGLQLHDLSDPRAPVRRWTVPGNVRAGALTLNATTVFAVLDGQLVALERATGSRRFALAGSTATHLQWIDNVLATFAAGEVRLYRIDAGGFTELGSLTIPITSALAGEATPRLRAAGDLVTLGGAGGFVAFSIADRRAPALLGPGVDTNPFLLDALPSDPTSVASIARLGGDSQVLFHDLTPMPSPATLGAIYDTPGTARALLLHQGFLYVADGPAGLTVIFQRPLDTGAGAGGPLAVSLAGSFSRPDALEEGSPFVLTATVRGGRPARVEFDLGGSRLGAARFPFRWTDTAPRADLVPSNLVFTARAIAASGIASTSAPVVIPLMRETAPPRPVASSPAEGALIPAGTTPTLSVTLSEPIDPSSIDDTTLTLWAAGPDTFAGTPDDIPVAVGATEVAGGGRVLRRTPSAPLAPGQHAVRLGTQLADLRGNRPTESVTWRFETERQVRWISDLDGSFSDASRWEGGTVPEYRDLAIIDRPAADPVVRLNQPDLFVGGILSRDPLVITHSLYATRGLRFEGGLSVSNRALLNAQGSVHVRGDSSWTGAGGLVVEASSLANAGRATLDLSGPAGLLVRNSVGGPPLVVNESGGELTLRGATTFQTDSFHPGALVLNAGALRSIANPGSTNRIVTRAFENRGLIHATGGHLELHNPVHLGRLEIDTDTSVTLLGTSSTDARTGSSSVISGEGHLVLDLRPGTSGSVQTVLAGSISLGGRLVTARTSRIALRGERTAVETFDAGGQLEFRGLAAQLGTLILRDATLTAATGTPMQVGTLDTASAFLGGSGGRLNVESSLHVSGPSFISNLLLSGPGTLRLAGPVTVSNSVTVATGSSLELGGTLTRVGGARVAAAIETTLRILPGGRLDLTTDRSVVPSGRFLNDGTLTVTQTSLENAAFQQGLPGRLVIRVGDPAGHDRLAVATAQLGGTLEVRLAPGADPALGQEFVILEAGRVTGTFDAVVLPELPPGRRFEVRYDATSVSLRVVS